jgi:hypothetical protein
MRSAGNLRTVELLNTFNRNSIRHHAFLLRADATNAAKRISPTRPARKIKGKKILEKPVTLFFRTLGIAMECFTTYFTGSVFPVLAPELNGSTAPQLLSSSAPQLLSSSAPQQLSNY